MGWLDDMHHVSKLAAAGLGGSILAMIFIIVAGGIALDDDRLDHRLDSVVGDFKGWTSVRQHWSFGDIVIAGIAAGLCNSCKFRAIHRGFCRCL